MIKSKKYHVQQLCLAGLFLGISLLSKFISYMIGPIILGFEIQLHYLPYIVGLTFLHNKKVKFSFFIVVPLLLIIFSNNGHPLLDYLLTMYSFFGFMFVNKIQNNLKFYIHLFLLSIFSFALSCWWNTLSGVVYYNFTFWASFLFNGLFNLINFLIIFIFLIIFYKLFSKQVNKNYEYINQSW